MVSKVTLSIAAVGAVLAWWFASIYKPNNDVCVSESLVLTRPFFSSRDGDTTIDTPPAVVTVDPCHVFSDTYQEARALFRQAAVDAGCDLHALPVYENYTIDVAVLPGTLPGLTVHTSGVHGVEGYAGSAVQIAFLEAIVSSTTTTKPVKIELPTMIFVHAFNPWGMSHYRRTNEHNVDLNRNALTDTEWQTYAANHYNRANYERFDSYLFNPARPPTLMSYTVEFWVRALIALQQHGLQTLKAAMVGGQYYQPTGIFYGGTETEPSTRLVEDFMKDYLSQHEELSTQTVTWIDVHTGIGPLGEDTMMSRWDSSIWPDKDPSKEFSVWFPDSHSPYGPYATSATGANVVSGYEQVKGLAVDYFENLFTADQKPLLAIQEFGTKPNVLVGHALVIENMAHHYSEPDEAIQWAQRTTRRAFYPANAFWRRQILERGLRALAQATKRSSQLSEQEAEGEQEQPAPDEAFAE
jgi:hypothetical protein